MMIDNEEQKIGAFRATWYMIRMQARNSTDKISASDDCFGHFIRNALTKLFCETCRPHSTEFLEKNPYKSFEKLRDVSGAYIGPFIYYHLFHNAVNERLGKLQISYDKALIESENEEIECSGCKISQEIPSGSYSKIESTNINNNNVNTTNLRGVKVKSNGNSLLFKH